MTANEDLIGLQNKVADLTEALALTQRTVTSINSIVTNINTLLTNTSTTNTNIGFISQDVIGPWSKSSVGGLAGDAAPTGPVSTTLGANNAVYVPFALTATKTAYKMFCLNGATATGNVDLGIYSSAGTRLVSIGATAQSGTDTTQIFDIADTSLAAGQYYMAISFSSTGTIYAQTISAVPSEFYNIRRQGTAHPLPATATFAAVAAGVTGFSLPVFGVALRSDFS